MPYLTLTNIIVLIKSGILPLLLIIFLVKGIKYFSKKDTDPTDKDRP